MSELKVNKVTPRSGTTVTLGDSGDTITIPSGATLDVNGIDFPTADGTAGQVLQTDGSGVLSFGTISSYTDTDALDLFNASGSAPVYASRAWVNFNGTGVVAIRESGNVSSITDNGTGNYTLNFTNAMPDANYSFAGAAGLSTGSGRYVSVDDNPSSTYLAASLRISANSAVNTKQDCDNVLVAVFR
jgi:hypothetical protein